MSNYPAGFAGFQARMEAAAEAAGGDALAWMAAEHAFAASIESIMRRDRKDDRDLYRYRRPHLGAWLRAREEDWANAAAAAEAQIYFDPEDAPEFDEGQQWRTIHGQATVLRVTRRAGIILATQHGRMVSLTDPGYALAVANGFTFRSHHRHYGSAQAASKAMARLTQTELRS